METSMLALHGLGVSRGYAIGRAVVIGAAALEVSHYRIAEEDVEAECARLRAAFRAAADELAYLESHLPADVPRELGAILQVHGMILADAMISQEPLGIIRTRHYNAEWALTAQGQALAEQFAQMDDEYMRERGSDVRQVIERVLHALAEADGKPRSLRASTLAEHGDPLVVVAHDISPADMLKLRGARFAAFATDLGGATSHTAIVARSMGVPAVVALGVARPLLRDGDVVIVDGEQGVLLVNPPDRVVDEYRARQADYARERATLAALRDVPAITLDGVMVSMLANIELPEEAEAAMQAGAEGIGLFRSEFLFMGRNDLPGEDEQYEAYASVVRTMAGRPVTIRTLDIGADKELDGEATVATNPALGLRGIRYCLAHPELFATQLRAILRASAHGPVKVLIPMVAHLREARAACTALAAARHELTVRGQACSQNIQIGAMVEVPAVAIAIEPFVEAFDFLSIGTNDLIQYTLAIDRADPDVAGLYESLHPAVLRLVANTINAGARSGKPVSVCGEMAGDTELTRLLLGLGLTQFSMHPQQLLDVKREILGAHSNALRTRVAAALNRAAEIDLSLLNQ
ncbi:Phosphoenolpyruvate-protein phosphotransferase [Pigmentiphaga humi]|uniref:Phosphoenolpyruvate-protein phosphotransferase n=1 Tax=Pigmentiphaga humi TaxID=2478468 RepID=A0A3P4AXS4_9BURK|nr:phosphoenolpyruvate--protein phosphotransferase [Pigmentiphaga humi]VCU68166.1 Phosphoenolpyruvate-protein phosphotransferase [Pigmentiphaga humi]